jgi:hypothetical protein
LSVFFKQYACRVKTGLHDWDANPGNTKHQEPNHKKTNKTCLPWQIQMANSIRSKVQSHRSNKIVIVQTTVNAKAAAK